MSKAAKPVRTWKVRSLGTGYEWEGMLVAYWEVNFDPISDDYTPKEITARELFEQWVEKVRGKYPNNLIPIHWFVECREHGVFEFMPFQFDHLTARPHEDFLTFFKWPLDPATGEQLNWLTLPVTDKLWNSRRADKGGFIQQATGWKLAILQPYVYLPALLSVLKVY